MTADPATPRGRFAPSPTGHLHVGSLVAALGSHLEARAAGAEWLVRIEDLDAPRSVPGAGDAILAELERLGLVWDGEVVRQSERLELYREALARLGETGLTFACGCSRKDLAGGGVYPGTCRGGIPPGREARSVRLRVGRTPVRVDDAVQDALVQDLEREVGDFVVRRADGIVAYHLAVVVDDAAQGITQVVRGADLLESTPRQIHLQRALGHPPPRYAHLPVAVDARGNKLGKQTRAPPTAALPPGVALARALDVLGHAPPADLVRAGVDDILAWARAHWDLARVPAGPGVAYEEVDRPAGA